MTIVIIVFSLTFVGYLIYLGIILALKSKVAQDTYDRAMQKGANYCIILPHTYGLPIPENMYCYVYSYSHMLEFEVAGANYQLTKDRVLDVSIKTDYEITKQAVSSAGGAVAGGMMFGPLGAMIGGRTKTKTVSQTFHYLIITYWDNNRNIQYIAFDATQNYKNASYIVQDFVPQAPQTVQL